MGLAAIGKMFPIPFYNGRIELHLNPTMRKFWKGDGDKEDETLDEHGAKVLTLSAIMHHRNTSEEDLLPWGNFPMHEITSQDPVKLWAEIKEYIRNQR
ncbi:hypothetical protein FBULB1_14203 [Fusarium bulbicola]|nr:hypothetical protein FBULB1_14203 [Fusarium bulbicola]